MQNNLICYVVCNFSLKFGAYNEGTFHIPLTQVCQLLNVANRNDKKRQTVLSILCCMLPIRSTQGRREDCPVPGTSGGSATTAQPSTSTGPATTAGPSATAGQNSTGTPGTAAQPSSSAGTSTSGVPRPGSSGQSATEEKKDHEAEGLAQLIPDIQETARLMQRVVHEFHQQQQASCSKTAEGAGNKPVEEAASLSAEERYLAKMRSLQFGECAIALHVHV